MRGDEHARARRHMRLDELPHLTHQLAVVDRRWSVRRVPAEHRAQGRHDLAVTMELHRLEIGQHQSQFTLVDLGHLPGSFRLREAFCQRGDLLAKMCQLFRMLGEPPQLLLHGVIAASNHRVTLDEPVLSLRNLASRSVSVLRS